jgi:hypothetical protein
MRLEAAILHNGFIVPGVFTKEQYNSALCNLALGSFVFYDTNNKDCFLQLFLSMRKHKL